MRCCVVFFVVFCTISAICIPAHSTWIENGVFVGNASYINNNDPQMILGDDNTVIIVWWTGEYSIIAQKIDLEGNPLWGPDGIVVGNMKRQAIDGPPSQPPQIASDGAGGVIVAWENIDFYLLGLFITAMRVHSTGILLWEPGGGSSTWGTGAIVIVPTPGHHEDHRIATLQGFYYKGAIVTWVDYTDWNAPNIYAQVVDNAGNIRGPAGGFAVCDTSGAQNNCDICALDFGGAFIVWQDERNGDSDIYIQRCWDSPIFQHQGIPVCTAPGSQTDPIVKAYDVFAVVAWNDSRPEGGGLYAQKIDYNGDIHWAPDGIPVCPESGTKLMPRFAPDNLGGYIFVWRQYDGVHAQRIDGDGNPLWGPGGVEVSSDVDFQHIELSPPAIATDAAGNSYISWSISGIQYFPYEPYWYWEEKEAVYIQKLDYLGVKQWNEEGVPLSTTDHKHLGPKVLCVDDESVIGSWAVRNDEGGSYIYCQHIDCPVPSKPAGLAGRHFSGENGLLGILLTWHPHPDLGGKSYVLYKGFEKDFIPSSENLVCALDDTIYFDQNWEWMPHAYYKLGVGTLGECHSWYTSLEYEEVYTDTEAGDMPPARIGLNNYPNPFNPMTTIKYCLPEDCSVLLEIFDVSGKRIATLVNEFQEQGQYAIDWNSQDHNGNPLSSGLYFCRLNAGKEKISRKMVLLR